MGGESEFKLRVARAAGDHFRERREGTRRRRGGRMDRMPPGGEEEEESCGELWISTGCRSLGVLPMIGGLCPQLLALLLPTRHLALERLNSRRLPQLVGGLSDCAVLACLL